MAPVFSTTNPPTLHQAIAYHQQAAQAEQDADNYRAARNTTIRTLHTTDPTTWTVRTLATATGLSTTTTRRALA